MGFFKGLANFGKKVLGHAVNAGKWAQGVRDKAVGAFKTLKDKLPDFVKAPLDAGIEFVMNSPVGRAAKMASGLLDTGVSAGDAVLSRMKKHEADTGAPPAAQLEAIGKRAQESGGDGGGGPDNSAQEARLAALQGGSE